MTKKKKPWHKAEKADRQRVEAIVRFMRGGDLDYAEELLRDFLKEKIRGYEFNHFHTAKEVMGHRLASAALVMAAPCFPADKIDEMVADTITAALLLCNERAVVGVARNWLDLISGVRVRTARVDDIELHALDQSHPAFDAVLAKFKAALDQLIHDHDRREP
jgi:hypothetical protein